MGLRDWNWLLPADYQDYPWDCAAASTAWCLRTIGLDYSEQDVINGLGPSRISPSYGLLDASGAGLVSWLAEIGVNAENNSNSSWQQLGDAAGYQPMVIGGRAWNHWVAVRIGWEAVYQAKQEMLALMNPAPGWMGVAQTLDSTQFNNLGTFSAVWFNSW